MVTVTLILTYLYQFEKIFKKFFVIHSYQVILLDNAIVLYFCVIAIRGGEGGREGEEEKGRKREGGGREERERGGNREEKEGRRVSSHHSLTATHWTHNV